MFDHIKNVRTEFKSTDLITDIELCDNYRCPLEIISSQSSCGLQLIDILLWLVKRYWDNPNSIRGNCRKLIDYIVPRAYITELTDISQKRELIKINRELFEKSFTKEDEYIAKENLEKIEQARRLRAGINSIVISD